MTNDELFEADGPNYDADMHEDDDCVEPVGKLMSMAADIYYTNVQNGWFDGKARTFGEDIALLHTEVSECFEAFQMWGSRDATKVDKHPETRIAPPKPEGLGSEIADVLIRLLDSCQRHGVNLDKAVDDHDTQEELGIGRHIHEALCELHLRVDRAFEQYRGAGDPTDAFVCILDQINYICAAWEIDLFAEYQRKMEFNQTRGYRHGNKVL